MKKEKLPDGWKILSIEKCISNQLSGFACAMSKLVENEGYVQLRPFNIEDEKLNLSTLYQVPLEMVDESKYFLEKGDILFNNTNSTELVGKSTISDKHYPFAFSNHINRIRVNPNVILPEYFHSYLRFMWSRGHFARHCKKWIGQSGYTLNKLKEQMILVPPLGIQREIVDKIDMQMIRIEIMKNEIEVQLVTAESYQISALQKTFQSNKDSWKTNIIKEVCQLNPRRPKLNYPDEYETTFLPMESLDENKGVIARPQLRSFKDVKKGYTYFEENDVLFAKITPCMQNKKSAIALDLHNKFGFGTTEWHVLRCSEKITPEWVLYFIRQHHFIEMAKCNFTGSVGQQRVPKNFLENYQISYPNVNVQKILIKKLRYELKECDELIENILNSFNAINQLPESILYEVFGKYELPDEV